jgi:hypothetical protein
MRENRNRVGCEEKENNMDKISLKDEKRGKIEREFKSKCKEFGERKTCSYRIGKGLQSAKFKLVQRAYETDEVK